MKYQVVLNIFILTRYSILSAHNIQKIIDSLAGSRGITRNIIVAGPFLSLSVALSPLGVHQRNFDCQSGHPTGTEVFIGTTSGRSSGYKPALQAPVRVRRVVPANHRISSLRRDVVESVLFSGRLTITSASGNLRRDFDSIYQRAVYLRKVDSGFGMPRVWSPNDKFVDRSRNIMSSWSIDWEPLSIAGISRRCLTIPRYFFFYINEIIEVDRIE